MGFIEIFLIGFGLSMDAFAVSVCKGLATAKARLRHSLIAGAWFGGFQALMPTIGYFLGSTFKGYITAIDHWIAFILLAIIGLNMIRESRENDEETDESFSLKTMLILAIATSIDALAVGVTFAFTLQSLYELLLSIGVIGVTTFILSAVGIWIGNVFGARFKSKAEFAGGIILVLIGLKILLEGIGIIY